MAEYRVQAYNAATQSENKIHDDAVARRFGFRGGLVPGVEVYAYLTHPIVAHWGRAWLERGAVGVRFLQPVYDGEEVVVDSASADAEAIEITARNPGGDLCATARATLPGQALAPSLAAYPRVPLPATPPPASPAALSPGTVLGSFEGVVHSDRAADYLSDVRERLPLYARDGIAHPGYLLRSANYILAANVKLGPWIHAGSEIRHFGIATVGDRVSTRGRVTSISERKGHKFVELDLLMIANDARPLMHVIHTAIYEPRQARA